MSNLSELAPNPKNPRTATKHKLIALRKTMEEFGDLGAIIFNVKSKQLVGGHQRSKAFPKADIVITKTYDTPTRTGTTAEGFVRIKGERFKYREVSWTQNKERAANIAANNNVGEWDNELLSEWMQDLSKSSFDMDLTLFDKSEREPFLKITKDVTFGTSESKDDAIPVPPKAPITKVGDVIQLGVHRLMCGDVLNPAHLTKLTRGTTIELVVTSPPYNQGLDKFKPSGMQNENPNWVNKMGAAYSDSMPEDEYQKSQIAALKAMYSVTSKTASVFYNHKLRYRNKEIITPYSWIVKSGWKIRQEIIWDRAGSITLNARMFMPCDERIYWLTKGDFKFNDTTEIKTWSSVWRIAPRNEIQGVSAPFPNEIPERCIAACSDRNDTVFEPYCGTGTTLIMAEKAFRRCVAMEINPAYCDVIVERWENLTGKKAKRP